MKKLRSVKLLATVLLSSAVTVGCAGQQVNDSTSKATPEVRQAIKNASDAISMANENNWIWTDTEDLLKEAQTAADNGNNAKAVELANQAKAQAEAAIIQYNHEKDHPRGL
jgi:pectate lyase